MSSRTGGYSKQAGVTLIISLVMLLVLTIAGVSAVQTTSIEERMARNTHDRLIAFQAAESALREGERFLQNNVNSTALFTDGGANGLWTTAPFNAQERWKGNIWGAGSPQSVEVSAAVLGVAQQPRFIVEWLATVQREENPSLLGSSYSAVFDRIEVFRVTARGVGGSPNARVMLQSHVGLVF
ncbi:MAG: PilX N-terminal domain-containing pilus assembly protein [Gammaproteobacteria bacterium]|nr:PilX N-terminal domain-containing pilus assembly protein [Gammaproteobacteria bacterium]